MGPMLLVDSPLVEPASQGLNKEPSPLVEQFEPHGVGVQEEVVSSRLHKEPVLDPALEDELVQELILQDISMAASISAFTVLLLINLLEETILSRRDKIVVKEGLSKTILSLVQTVQLRPQNNHIW